MTTRDERKALAEECKRLADDAFMNADEDGPSPLTRNVLWETIDRLAALPQPAVPSTQEPVAWGCFKADGRLEMDLVGTKVCCESWRDAEDAQGPWIVAPLYAAAIPQPAAVPSGWQPIKTAPKQGYILVANENADGAYIAHWMPIAVSGYRFEQPWRSVMLNHYHISSETRYLAPTHWMPLPAAPQPHGDKP